MAAHQAPLSLGFSRQEHWSGLPFPSPVHESEKWQWSCSVVSDSLQPRGLQPTRPLRPWDFPGKSTGVGCHCLLWTKPTGYNKDSVQSKNKIKLRKKKSCFKLTYFLFPGCHSLISYPQIQFCSLFNADELFSARFITVPCQALGIPFQVLPS